LARAWNYLSVNSKVLDKVEIVRSNQVRRAKLFYLRALKGKAARLREVDHRAVAAKAEAAETAARPSNSAVSLAFSWGRNFRSFSFVHDRPGHDDAGFLIHRFHG